MGLMMINPIIHGVLVLHIPALGRYFIALFVAPMKVASSIFNKNQIYWFFNGKQFSKVVSHTLNFKNKTTTNKTTRIKRNPKI